MNSSRRPLQALFALACGIAAWCAAAAPASAQLPVPRILPEQRSFQIRDPSELPRARLPSTSAPPTVTRPPRDLPPFNLSLDDAVRWSLANSEVVRLLAGVQAVSSGRTIYDAAIANTAIDEQQARFDPTAQVTNTWNRSESPFVDFAPGDPMRAVIDGLRTDSYELRAAVTQQTISGAQLAAGVNANPLNRRPGTFPLNPESRSSADITLTQPLLQGFSPAANLAPVVVARIDTERSYFQMKDALQENVRSVVEAYWALVNARTDAWTRRQQVEQATEAFRLAEGRFKAQINNAAEVAQARLTLANFRAQAVVAEGAVLQREAALRNLLGFPPADGEFLVPVTPPTVERYEPVWDELVALAEERRPDLIELKLIVEADEQSILRSRNLALPQVDAVGQYRWNGLEGEMPIGDPLRSRSGQFTDWTLGVNFSVPLGLRQSRATLRRSELLLARDRANLQQGLHAAVHELATSVRSLDQAYEQFQAFKEARDAARLNLDQQLSQYRANRVIFLNVLQAITDWGNAISAEANALTAYNTLLAVIEKQTGTILETHGVWLYEESFGAIGPRGRLARPVAYPAEVGPTENEPRYPAGERPAEESFDLQSPATLRERRPAALFDAAPPGRAPAEPLPPPVDPTDIAPPLERPAVPDRPSPDRPPPDRSSLDRSSRLPVVRTARAW